MNLSPEDLSNRLEQKPDELLLLDVRTEEEFAAGHIEGSLNLPLHELQARFENLPKDRDIVTICAVGMRSANAALFLKDKGYDAFNLEGGLINWNNFQS